MKFSMDPRTKRQRLAARERPVSHALPFSHLNTPTVFETKQGDQGCVIQVDGWPAVLADPRHVNAHQRRFANFLVSLSEAFAVYVTTHRRTHRPYPEGDFPAGFARDFNDAYYNQYATRPLYVNNYFITVMIKRSRSKMGRRAFCTSRGVGDALTIANDRQHQQAALRSVVRDLLHTLEALKPRLLGENTRGPVPTSDLLAFFSLLVNGEPTAPLPVPTHSLVAYLPTRRLSFGHATLEWHGNTTVSRQFGAMLSIKHYGAQTATPALAPLLRVDCEYLHTQAFLRENNTVALARIRTQQKHLGDANDAALSQQAELVEAMDDVAGGRVAFGQYHHTLLVLADDIKTLEQNVARVSKCYRDADIIAVRESLNLESAFWAQLPGNFHHMHRRVLLSSDNVADFCSFHTGARGYCDHNHVGSAVMVVETPSRTPLYLNFHERSQGKHDLSKGHTTIIAPSNAGKTTLMNALDAQAQKYRGTSVFFDRDQGCEIYVRAMNGAYTRICPGQATGFNPLQLEDTPENRDFLTHWLGSLCMTEGQPLTASERRAVATVVHRAYTLPLEKRRLSVVSAFFPADFTRLDALRPWVRSQDGRFDGQWAYLFDNVIDTLSFERSHAGFDLTHLLDHTPAHVVFSVMLYLFHRIEQHSDGRLLGIYLDEGWQFLENPYWQAKLNAYLPTLRKRNVYLVFSTQSPGTVARSPSRDALIQGSATHIFLPNPKADAAHYCDGFKLSQQEYDWVKHTDFHTRQFLIKQGSETAIGTLNLRGMDDFVAVLSGHKATVNLLDAVRAEVGDDPHTWLPVFHARRPK